MENCPCASDKVYENCCLPFHEEKKNPPTAEALMRARYSAFVKNKIDFIGNTHIPGTKDFDIEEAKNWSTNSHWKGLEILSTKQGEASHSQGSVEFKAIYSDKENHDYHHHEISTFKKIDDKWYYVDGQIVGTGPILRSSPKVGRNESCPCGSEKKFKKCCGA